MFIVVLSSFKESGTTKRYLEIESFESITNLGGQKSEYKFIKSSVLGCERSSVYINDSGNKDSYHEISVYSSDGILIDRSRWNINYEANLS